MASRPNLAQRRSTSSVVQLAKKDGESGDAEPSTSAPKRSTKQFVAHSRHHRVPSGRNLKKLIGTRSHGDLVALAQAAATQQAQVQAAAVNQGSKAHSTSPVPPWERIKEKEKEAKSGGHELKKRSRSNPKRSLSTPNANSKKANFQFASAPGSFEDTADQLAQAELDDVMNADAAKSAYMGQARTPVTPTQPEIPDVSRKAQLDEVTPSRVASNGGISNRVVTTPQSGVNGGEHRKSASTSHIRSAPAPTKQPPATAATKLANGDQVDAGGDLDSSDTPKMNTPQTPQPFLTPKSDTQSHKTPRPSPPFHHTNHPTAIPPQVSTMNAIAHADGRRSMSSTSSGPTPQPVTSRFITSSPGGALSSPSSVRDTPVKQRNSISFDTPPTPHATPPSEAAPISTLNHDAILRKPGSSNIGAGKALPNRTQTKILLQRQISQAELEQERQQQQMQMQQGQMYYHNSHSRRGSMNTDVSGSEVKLPREAMREVERINREYANVRRFISPVGDSVVRLKGYMKNNRIPSQRRSLERDGSGPQSLGLSQSLGANVGSRGGDGTRAMVSVSGGGSKDDFGLAGRSGGMDEAKIRELLIHVWNRDEPGNNNLSSSN